MVTSRRRLWVVLLVGSFLFSGCGNLTAGGFAEAEVELVGDRGGNDSQSRPQSQTAGRSSPEGAPAESSHAGGNPFHGEVRVDLRVYLEPEGEGDGLQIFRSDQVVVDVRGEAPFRSTSVTIPPGRYRGARVVFTRVTANITQGGPGVELPLDGEVSVELGDGVEVREERTFLVNDRQRVVVEIDLQSPRWLQQLSPGIVQIPPDRFTEAVRVRVRQEFGVSL